MVTKIIIDKIDLDPQSPQELEAIITLNIVFRIDTINGHRVVILRNFPYYRRYVIYVIKVSYKK